MPLPIKGTPFDRTYTTKMIGVPGAETSFDYDVNDIIEEFDYKLTGTLLLAGYTAAPTLRTEGIENLIANFRLSGNANKSGTPTVNFSNADASLYKLKTTIIEGTAPDRVDVGSNNGTYHFETNFTKYFGAKRTDAGEATYLDTRDLQSLRAIINWRGVEAIVKPGSGTAGTPTLSDVQVTFHEIAWQNGQRSAGRPYISETVRPFDLTGGGAVLERKFEKVPIGNILLRQYFKGMVGDTNYSDPSDAFFTTNLRDTGAFVKTRINGSWDKGLNATYAHLQSYDRRRFSLEQWPVGYAVHEYSRTGKIADALNLMAKGPNAVNSCDNYLDVTPVAGETNTLNIYDEQLIFTPAGS